MIGGRNSPGAWSVTLYPEVGEGSAVWRVERDDVERAEVSDPDPDASQVRAARRARTMIRRYTVKNRLRYMWVLTFREAEFQHVTAMREVAAFAERLRAAFPTVGPYLYAGEPHPLGHGWHTNFFTNVWMPIERVRLLWGHGHVYVKDWPKDPRLRGLSLREKLRRAALYAAKYTAKTIDALTSYGCVREDGEHRYERAQGWDARPVKLALPTMRGVRSWMAEVIGHIEWRESWLSDDLEWRGPPCLWVAWDI